MTVNYGPYDSQLGNRGYCQPQQTKKETPEEEKNRKQREAVEDIKKYKAALKEAKERYQAYDLASEAKNIQAREDTKDGCEESSG